MTKTRFQYGVKSFSLYFIVGALAAFIPLAWLSVVFGLPSILIGSISLGTGDAMNLKLDTTEENQTLLIVFTKLHKIMILFLIITDFFYWIWWSGVLKGFLST